MAPYQSADGQVELDTVAIGDATWVVEIKWQNRPASRADLEGFRAKVRTARPHLPRPPDVLWFIAKTGLTPSAEKYAREKGILISTEGDLQALAERLGVRFGK